jgi:hypothetical protein
MTAIQIIVAHEFDPMGAGIIVYNRIKERAMAALAR